MRLCPRLPGPGDLGQLIVSGPAACAVGIRNTAWISTDSSARRWRVSSLCSEDAEIAPLAGCTASAIAAIAARSRSAPVAEPSALGESTVPLGRSIRALSRAVGSASARLVSRYLATASRRQGGRGLLLRINHPEFQLSCRSLMRRIGNPKGGVLHQDQEVIATWTVAYDQ